jgi:16S rRNA (uracil1498-N3)-methyltransferase
MPRRVHVVAVTHGDIIISKQEAHHLRDVLRLRDGATVQVFDDGGRVGTATLRFDGQAVIAQVQSMVEVSNSKCQIVVASAMPKGNRADWMIEKLSELGVHTFIPLISERSVVLAEGKNKLERWRRIATEAAKQSHRSGVMHVEAVQPLAAVIQSAVTQGSCWQLSTDAAATPIINLHPSMNKALTIFIGPEGDWSEDETAQFQKAEIPAVSLGKTILRIETAAVAAAAILGAHFDC